MEYYVVYHDVCEHTHICIQNIYAYNIQEHTHIYVYSYVYIIVWLPKIRFQMKYSEIQTFKRRLGSKY